AVGALVWLGTHPSAPPAVTDPHTRGLFFTVEEFTSADGTQLKGWLVPVIDAKRVLDQRDDLLRHVQPAVVLVHDYGQSPQQMLPLLESLHEEGLVLLVVGLRGIGTDSRVMGQTFGFSESQDV